MRRVFIDGNNWNKDLCYSNLDSLFIFGDNFDDQKPIAMIKECPNVFGIPVKKNTNEYYIDKEFEKNMEYIDEVFDKMLKVILYNNYRKVFISERIFDLSYLEKYAPQTYNHIGRKIAALVNIFNYKKMNYFYNSHLYL